jgi:phenylalanine ammonia-lyase
MEKMRLSLAHQGKVIFAQFTEMLNPYLNHGLPPSAAATDPSLNYYAKGLDIAAAAYVAELNYLANPVSVHSVAAEMMNQSINSLALINARMTGSALDVLSLVHGSPSSQPK